MLPAVVFSRCTTIWVGFRGFGLGSGLAFCFWLSKFQQLTHTRTHARGNGFITHCRPDIFDVFKTFPKFPSSKERRERCLSRCGQNVCQAFFASLRSNSLFSYFCGAAAPFSVHCFFCFVFSAGFLH